MQVRGPDGKPVEGAWGLRQIARGFWQHERLAAEFPVYALAAGEKRTLLLRRLEEKNLAARAEIKRTSAAQLS